MTGDVLTFHLYYLGDVARACRLFDSLACAFLGLTELPSAALQCQQNIITQFLKPPLQKKQTLARRPNALDRAQGHMELFINANDKLSNCQQRALRSISIMQPSDLYLIGGESGTGKTMALLNAANMTSRVGQKVRVLYVAPTAQMLSNVLQMLR